LNAFDKYNLKYSGELFLQVTMPVSESAARLGQAATKLEGGFSKINVSTPSLNIIKVKCD
jgi:hypothetical protein